MQPREPRLMHRTQVKGGRPFFDPSTLTAQASAR
jgi:hypothetical protein